VHCTVTRSEGPISVLRRLDMMLSIDLNRFGGEEERGRGGGEPSNERGNFISRDDNINLIE